jgi:hypothetical protein
MAKQRFTLNLGADQICEAPVQYSRGMVDPLAYGILVSVGTSAQAIITCTKKRAPRKAKPEAKPKAPA